MELLKKGILLVSTIILLMSCNEKEVDVKISPDVYHDVVDKVIDIMVDDIFSPPVASRIFTYSNIGLAIKKWTIN